MKGFLNGLGLFLGAVSVSASLVPAIVVSHKYMLLEDPSALLTGMMDSVLLMTISLAFLAMVTIFTIITFSKRSEYLNEQLKDLPVDNERLQQYCDQSDLVFSKGFNGIHNIVNDYKYLGGFFDTVLSLGDEASVAQLSTAHAKFLNFLNLVSVTASDFYSDYTGDQCAITIKLVKDGYVKTLHRDMFSYRHRNSQDATLTNGRSYYHISENSSFGVFTNDEERRTYFFCDDLKAAAYEGQYKNLNANWMTLYNATAVSPIWIKDLTSKDGEIYNLYGFFCVDNFLGGLGDRELQNFSGAIASILYNVFQKFEPIAVIAQAKGVTDDKIKAFTDWNGDQ